LGPWLPSILWVNVCQLFSFGMSMFFAPFFVYIDDFNLTDLISSRMLGWSLWYMRKVQLGHLFCILSTLLLAMWSKGPDLRCPSEGHRWLVPLQERLLSNWQTVTTCSVKSCQQPSIDLHLWNPSWLLGCYYHSVERVFSVEHIPHVMWLFHSMHWICFQRFAHFFLMKVLFVFPFSPLMFHPVFTSTCRRNSSFRYLSNTFHTLCLFTQTSLLFLR
jgi:hypothetical protein